MGQLGQTAMKNIFKLEFTLGTVIQMLTMISLAVGAYYKFDARLTANENRSASVEAALRQTNARQDRTDETIANVLHNQTRLTTLIEERTRTKGRL